MIKNSYLIYVNPGSKLLYSSSWTINPAGQTQGVSWTPWRSIMFVFTCFDAFNALRTKKNLVEQQL